MTAIIRDMAGFSGDAQPANRLLSGGLQAPDSPFVMTPLETSPASAGGLSGFTVTLPLPPSTNNLFITRGKRRVRSPEYEEWLTFARHALRSQGPDPVVGRYAFLIALPALVAGDCSNRIKAPEDLLVKEGLTPDDRHADVVVAHRCKSVSGVACIVTVVPIQHVSAALASVGGGPRPLPDFLPRGGAEAA